MSSTIRTNGLLFALAVLSLAGCKRPEPQPTAAASPAAVAPQPSSPTPAASVRADPAAVAEPGSRVVDLTDIEVAGQRACTMMVRYPGLTEQPVTWQGQLCDALTFEFMNLEQLEKLGQVGKLSAEQREDVLAMPGGKALYIEGGFTSAIYPANAAQRVYTVWLTD